MFEDCAFLFISDLLSKSLLTKNLVPIGNLYENANDLWLFKSNVYIFMAWIASIGLKMLICLQCNEKKGKKKKNW